MKGIYTYVTGKEENFLRRRKEPSGPRLECTSHSHRKAKKQQWETEINKQDRVKSVALHQGWSGLPRKHLWMPGGIFGCHTGQHYGNLVGRGQVCCSTLYSAQDSLTQPRMIQPQISVVLGLRNHGLGKLEERRATGGVRAASALEESCQEWLDWGRM